MAEQSQNKKILFIVGGYIVVAILFILLFTVAKYTKDLDGETFIPQAKGFAATLELGDENGLSKTVGDLLPDTTATEKVAFQVSNYEAENLSEGNPTAQNPSESKLEYTITVLTAGNLPLDMDLIQVNEDGTETTYTGLRMLNVSDTLGEGYRYTFYDDDDLEAKFNMNNTSIETEKFQLKFHWKSNTTEVQYSAESYQREIELLEIRTVVEAGAPL